MASELEWKFDAPPETLAALSREPWAWRELTMETLYYDTADRALSARRWTLRLRREGGAPVVCLKTPGTEELGAFRRGEWEWRGPSVEEGIPHLIAAGAPRELEALTAGKPLGVLCGARFTRRAAGLALEGASAELALDEGALLGGGRELPLSELEVEHKSGDPAATAAFAAELAARLGLAAQEKSKFQRALDVL